MSSHTSQSTSPPLRRRMKGTVVSDKMDKTIVVEVGQVRMHPRYKKRYTVTQRYKAHDEDNRFHEGDVVTIEESRPISREKRWSVVLDAAPSDDALPTSLNNDST